MPRKRETSKSSYGNPVHNDHEAIICGDGQSVKQFKLGDIAWIKTRKCWWPGQVVDEGSVSFSHKKKVKDGVLVRMYGCYEYLYVDPAKYSNEFENILKQENLSIREAFQKAMDEVRSGGKSKGKVCKSRGKDAIKDKKRKQDEIDRTEGVSSGEAEEVSALKKKRDVKEKIDGKQKPAAKASKGDSKIKANVTQKAKVGTPKGKNSKQEDVKEPTQTKSPATTMNHAAEEPTSIQSERRTRVMQSLGLIAPVGSPFRRNGFVLQSSLQ